MVEFKSFSATICGAEHTKVNKVCQDASAHYSDETMEIAIVADGHGSDDYFRSHIGSSMAVEVALSKLKRVAKIISEFDNDKMDRFRNDRTQQDDIMNTVKQAILEMWHEEIKKDHEEMPFSDEELEKVSEKYIQRYANQGIFEWAYGTTLIAAVVTKQCWFALQLGDGNCVELYKENGFVESMPRDPKCVGEASSSLCQADALESFRHYLSFSFPQMILVHTDGIDDSLLDDETRKDVYLTVGASFVKEFEEGVENIEKNILTHIAQNWKRDDTSLAGIVCMDDLKEQAQILLKQRVDGRSAADYSRACKRKEELERICDALRKTIESSKLKHKELESEYTKLSTKANEILTLAKKNREIVEQNETVLERRLKELEECNKVIVANSSDRVNDEFSDKARTSARRGVHDMELCTEPDRGTAITASLKRFSDESQAKGVWATSEDKSIHISVARSEEKKLKLSDFLKRS